MSATAEILSGEFDPTAVVAEPVPPVVGSGEVDGVEEENSKGRKQIVLGRNVHTSCLEVTEPEANDELTGDKDAYMAGVLARYRKNLMERTKHHLGKFHSHFYSTLWLVFGFLDIIDDNLILPRRTTPMRDCFLVSIKARMLVKL